METGFGFISGLYRVYIEVIWGSRKENENYYLGLRV